MKSQGAMKEIEGKYPHLYKGELEGALRGVEARYLIYIKGNLRGP